MDLSEYKLEPLNTDGERILYRGVHASPADALPRVLVVAPAGEYSSPETLARIEPLEQDAEYHFTTGHPGPLTPAADEVYLQFVMVDALAQFATDKMDLEQTVKWVEERIKAIYAKFV
jgi:hypothetical protein